MQKLPPSQKLRLDIYDWKKGGFYEGGVTLWIGLFVKLLLAVILSLGPPILVYMNLVPNAYPLLSMTPPNSYDAIVEALRFIWLIGVSYLVYVITQIVLCIIPSIAFYVYKVPNVDMHQSVRRSVETLLSLRTYIGYAAGGAVLAAFGRALYPQPSTTAAVAAAAAAGGPKAAKKVTLALIQQDFSAYIQRPPQFFIANACLSIGIICGILLFEKVVVKAVAHRFHAHGLAHRIEINKFARKVTKGLREHFLGSKTLPKSKTNGEIIFDTLGKAELSKEDFYAYMDESEAIRYFNVIDPDMVGSLDRGQFIAAIDSLYGEQSAIDRAFLDQTKIIDKFDRLLMAVVVILSILVVCTILEPPIDFLLTSLVALVIGLVVVFGATARTAFESIIFIIFTHPFDADDMIVVDDVYYLVEELGLWNSTFVTTSGQLVYIPNVLLASKPIVNLRRSPIMSELISFSVLPTTSQDKVKKLEERLLQFLKANLRDYVPNIFIRGFRIRDKEHMQLEFTLSHRSNFNNMMKREQRTKRFMFFLREAIQELKIELSPPLKA